MRSLAFLTALLFLAFQAQAETLQETADQVPTQDQPGDEDQDQPGDEDQDVAVSFTGEEHFAGGAADFQKKPCTCRTGFCLTNERYVKTCKLFRTKGRLCCP